MNRPLGVLLFCVNAVLMLAQTEGSVVTDNEVPAVNVDLTAAGDVAGGGAAGASVAPVDGPTEKDLARNYSSPTAKDRVKWVVRGTIGLPNATADLFTAAMGTWSNEPEEYGTHWDGFGKRYGLRMVDSATGRTIEATLGSFWGEDPRYYRVPERAFKNRVYHVLKRTFMSTDRSGHAMPAYAAFLAVPANSFLSNQWRPDSEANVHAAVARIPGGFIDRLIGNAFAEFWPDLRKHVSK
jgi:hypothetical protein